MSISSMVMFTQNLPECMRNGAACMHDSDILLRMEQRIVATIAIRIRAASVAHLMCVLSRSLAVGPTVAFLGGDVVTCCFSLSWFATRVEGMVGSSRCFAQRGGQVRRERAKA